MTQQNGEPQPGGGFERLYSFTGDGLQITYSQVTEPDAGTTDSLSYQDPDGNHTFIGNALRFQTSEMGRLLSVTLQVNQDTGEEIKLTVLLPGVHRAFGTVPIQTLAIRTSSLNPTNSPPGQVQTYQVYHLEGTDKLIFFE